MARMDPRAMIVRFVSKEYYLTLLHTKYKSSRTRDFREKGFFLYFPIVSIWELMTILTLRT